MNKKQAVRRLVRVLKARYARGDTAMEKQGPRGVFRVLAGCILSQRTRDERTEQACAALFSEARSAEQLSRLSLSRMRSLIKPVNYYKTKARTLKKLAKVLLRKHGGRVPAARGELMSLPGVGPKTAAVVLCYGFGKPCIPVDVHVEVVAKRLGLVPQNAAPVEVQQALEGLVPVKDQPLINAGLVNFGREVCRTALPKCPECELHGVCRAFRRKWKAYYARKRVRVLACIL